MSTSMQSARNDALTPEMEAAMEQFGIVRFPVYFYQFRQHKYSNLKDAISQAEREQSAD